MTKKKEHSLLRSASFWKRLVGILLLSGIAGTAAWYWQQNVRVSEVSVSGSYFTDSEEIIRAAAVPEGIRPDSLDLEVLKRSVESLNYVHSVVPYIEPSGDLQLQVRERQPIALLLNGSNRAYVDSDGVKLPVYEGKTLDLPLVYGFDTGIKTDTLQSTAFLEIRDFLLQAKKNGFGWITISEVAYDPKDGVVALSHENGVKLLFGHGDFEYKLQNWEAFYGQVIKTKGIGRMQQVDLRFINQVVTRES